MALQWAPVRPENAGMRGGTPTGGRVVLAMCVSSPTAATGHAETQPRDLTLGPPSRPELPPAPALLRGARPGCPGQDQLSRWARWGSQEPLHREPREARFPLHSP